MKTLIELLVASAVTAIIAFQGGKYGLRQAHDFIQRLALEKAARGLGRLESAAQTMTGGRLDF